MRTRFPPSPTGFLHIGNLRTALFAWLMAKKTGGIFTLRIEDTDQVREVPGAVEKIVQTLAWAGLRPDEGVMLDESGTLIEKGEYGPYHQSKRLPIYRKYVDELLMSGHAYHCFCTTERLEEMRKKQQALHQAPMYDRHCINLPAEEVKQRITAGEKHVIRMRVPREETITYHDEIYGDLSFKGHTIDDQVLLKSDGFPTYHLAHVVDDHLMKMDMVNRGEDWLPSLPKHLLLFRFFGWEPPKYAHVPLLLNKDRSKLSKRQGDVAAEDYWKKGYLPEAIINFLALLGWNPGTTQELFSLDELIQAFSLDRVHKAGAVFDVEKLDWLQGQWMRKFAPKDFADRIRPIVGVAFKEAMSDEKFTEKAALIQGRIMFFHEASDMMGFFYSEPHVTANLLASEKQKVKMEDLPKIMELLTSTLSAIPEGEWSREGISNALESAITSSGFKKGQILWPLRAALTGREYSPGAYEVALLLGKEVTIARIMKATKNQ
ncbi:MAG TPA: glutamate--tRNA ligase [Candidatus Peribacterales bacterium]|nr:glutamate--tRNA ligase [Candidatus Peribacterales bacterium]